ncbi:MAG: hypothetical protein LIR50_20275 [Bacillota bacterium]|nr:hypothetical protein [Bacillota bacterium]
MKLKPYQKNALSVLAVAAGGFILFNLAFILAAIVINGSMRVLGISENAAPPATYRVLYLLLIFLISWLVFRSRLNEIIKASFLAMLLMVLIVMEGLSLYQYSKWITIGIGAVIISTVLFYIHKKKLTRLYYFSAFYVAVLGLCVMIFNIQI